MNDSVGLGLGHVGGVVDIPPCRLRARLHDDRACDLHRHVDHLDASLAYTPWVADVIEGLPPDAPSNVAVLEEVGISSASTTSMRYRRRAMTLGCSASVDRARRRPLPARHHQVRGRLLRHECEGRRWLRRWRSATRAAQAAADARAATLASGKNVEPEILLGDFGASSIEGAFA